jgi:SAM-dependent methyltransferase
MSATQQATNFDATRAKEYDDKSNFDKGDRARHREYLDDLLRCLAPEVNTFVELGCGTGFYTEVLLDRCPTAHGILVDGSAPMLDVARSKLSARAGVNQRLDYRHCKLEELDLGQCTPRAELIFAGITLCYLTREARARAVADVYRTLADDGVFVLFDQYKPDDAVHARTTEYLACSDMRRRFAKFFRMPIESPALQVERLIAADRKSKAEDGDHEVSIEEHVRLLTGAGFAACHVLFIEPRLFGLVAYKQVGLSS